MIADLEQRVERLERRLGVGARPRYWRCARCEAWIIDTGYPEETDPWPSFDPLHYRSSTRRGIVGWLLGPEPCFGPLEVAAFGLEVM